MQSNTLISSRNLLQSACFLAISSHLQQSIYLFKTITQCPIKDKLFSPKFPSSELLTYLVCIQLIPETQSTKKKWGKQKKEGTLMKFYWNLPFSKEFVEQLPRHLSLQSSFV